jgi:[acyl-carrier-protein] S-malonyltransferase
MGIAFLFPGQGSQEVGMGQDLFQKDAYFKGLVRCAADITHEDCEKLCLHGPEKKLAKARFLQPLLAAVSLGYLRYVLECGIEAQAVCGHSFGEITALAACNIVSVEEVISMAAKRGELMDEAAGRCNGGMMAVHPLSAEKVIALIQEKSLNGSVVLANDNAPTQTVESGELSELKELSTYITERKLGACTMLPVSGPWHSPFMQSAQAKFEQWVAAVEFHKPTRCFIMNASALEETDPVAIRKKITGQLTSPIFWRQSMETLKKMGIDRVLEIGPGRILSGLVRANKFPRQTVIYNVNNLRGLERAVEDIKLVS